MIGYLNTDGGARGNPGPAAIGIVLKDENKNSIETKGIYLGNTTNNFAEYKGILEGLKLAKIKGVTEINCFLDSELVVKQLLGLYKVKEETLKLLHKEVKEIEKEFIKVTYTHVRREFNKEADLIVNKVLDSI